MNPIIEQLRVRFNQLADEKVRTSSNRFFKESVNAQGIKSADVEKLSSEYFKLLTMHSKKEVFDLCEELFKSGILEESFVACHWSYKLNKQYEAADWIVFERWVNSYVTNWATCDTFCNHSVGELIEQNPGLIDQLKSWTGSDNRWVRRASAVSLIVPARKGLFLRDVFEIADQLLTDTDDMVQKGYGWMLKVTSQKHLEPVFDYVMKHKSTMPRTALRYAIEKMPEDLKKKCMIK